MFRKSALNNEANSKLRVFGVSSARMLGNPSTDVNKETSSNDPPLPRETLLPASQSTINSMCRKHLLKEQLQ